MPTHFKYYKGLVITNVAKKQTLK